MFGKAIARQERGYFMQSPFTPATTILY
jgi:hypothetical protein